MRRTFAVILAAAILSQSGCTVLAEALIDVIFDSRKSKQGTSRDRSLPKEERRALWEEEFRKYMEDKEKERQRKRYNEERRREPPAKWENSIDSAFPQR